MILVTGATGTTGRHLVPALRAKGARVRALVRDPRTAPATWDDGVEPAAADMSDPSSLTAAADGVQAVYLLAPVGESMASYERNVIYAAARSASRPRVVLHAAAGFMRHPDGARFLTAHAEALRHLRATGLAWTALAPNGFFQNFLSLRARLAAGVLPAACGPQPH